jgi:PAS domain S-box-containing protein
VTGDSTYRAAKIAYVSITMYVVLAAAYLLFAARFDSKIQEIDALVASNVDTWRKIATLSGELVELQDASNNLPPHVLHRIQENLSLLLDESGSIQGRINQGVAEINQQFISIRYRDQLVEIIREGVKPSVQRHVRALASAPNSLFEARYTSPLPVDAVLLRSGAALDPLLKQKQELTALHAEIVGGRAPMEMSVLAVLLISIWSSWFGLLLPSFKRGKIRQEQILAAEERSRVTLNSIGDAVIVADAHGRLESMNPMAERILGYQFNEIQGRPIDDFLKLYRTSDGAPIQNPVDHVLASGGVIELANGTSLRNKSGEFRLIADAAAPIRYPDGNIRGAIVVFRDVTEEYALRNSVMQSDKLRAVGLLAGGMAHEFNNALAIISGACELMKPGNGGADKDSFEQQRHLEIVDQAIKRSSSLTNRLLAIGRRSEIAIAPVDLLRIVDDAVEVLRRTHDRCINIDVHCTLDQSRRAVSGDAPALQGVFINLGLNSIQSIEGPGKIDISIVESGPPLGLETDQRNFIKVVWSDDGHGIASEDMDRIFEPFFTTKSAMGGSGLGLSVIQGTISLHSGAIEVNSKRGDGTTFTIYLPTTDRLEAAAPVPTADVVAVVAGAILIVDDETSFLEIVAEYLTSYGYKTLTASAGTEAMTIFTQNTDQIDVVILDMNMPEISGPELARRIYEVRPDCKIIISSGYANCSIEDLDPPRFVYLKKPYDLKDLLGAIAQVVKMPKAKV